MPNNNQLPVQAGVIPQGFCPGNYQDILNEFSSLQSVILPPSASSLQVSATKPTNTTLPWLQIDNLGRPVRIYVFAQGSWLSLHPDFPGKTIIYTGVLPDFTIFDGGDANALSPYSGPMWQLANTALDGSGTQILGGTLTSAFPLGVGTLPSGAAVGLLATGGEEKHLLTTQELAPHNHLIANKDRDTVVALSGVNSAEVADTGNYELVGTTTVPTLGQTSPTGGDPATNAPPNNLPVAALGHNTIPTFVGVYFLQRTSRLYYSVT